jgi:hypothetical protein
MLSQFSPRQRRAIIVFGSLWVGAIVLAALGALLNASSP